ncbi:MAG: anti-sigma factor domain-containing protein [Nitrospiraceae bacterium]
MAHEQFEDILPLYAIGALDPHERQAMEAHLLTGCAACHASLKDFQGVAGILPYALPPAPVPPALRQQTIKAAFRKAAQVHEAAISESPRRVSWLDQLLPPLAMRLFQPAVTMALLLLVLGTGWYAWRTHSQVAAEVEQRRRAEIALQEAVARATQLQQQVAQKEAALVAMKAEVGQTARNANDIQSALNERETELSYVRTQLAQVEKDTAGLRRALAQRDEMLTFLRSAHVKVVSLSGLETAKSAGAFLLFDRETKKAFFYAFNMPPLPPGKTYQLWAIVDKPMSAGVFETDDGHKGRLIIRNLPDWSRITKFAVSLEPEGGRPQPTGDLYLAGQI